MDSQMKSFKQIIIRADGNSQIGLGHVYRMLALGKMFENLSVITFVSRDQEIAALLPEKFEFVHLNSEVFDSELDLGFLKATFKSEDSVVFLDGYQFDENYQRELKLAGFGLVFTDDMISFKMQADVVINPSLGIKKSDYQYDNTIFGLGPQFAALRPEYLAEARKPIKNNIEFRKKLFVSLGGSDYHNITPKILKAIDQINEIREVVVLTGSSFANDIKKVDGETYSLEQVRDLSASELIKVIDSCDLALTSASTISQEVACVKRPLAIGYYVNNQYRLYHGAVETGIAFGLGDLLSQDEAELAEKIKVFLESDHIAILKSQAEVFDGRNRERNHRLIIPLLSKLSCRSVNEGDLELLFNWSNDRDVRANAIHQEPIQMDGHKKWFKTKLQDDDSYIFIFSDDQGPVGQVRFDLNDQCKFEIDYSVDKNSRGKGYGKQLIAIGIDRIRRSGRNEAIIAKVFSHNKASIAVFDGLGFYETDFVKQDNMHIFEHEQL